MRVRVVACGAFGSKRCILIFAFGHLWRVVTVLTGCYPRQRAICTFVFSSYVRRFHDLFIVHFAR